MTGPKKKYLSANRRCSKKNTFFLLGSNPAVCTVFFVLGSILAVAPFFFLNLEQSRKVFLLSLLKLVDAQSSICRPRSQSFDCVYAGRSRRQGGQWKRPVYLVFDRTQHILLKPWRARVGDETWFRSGFHVLHVQAQNTKDSPLVPHRHRTFSISA